MRTTLLEKMGLRKKLEMKNPEEKEKRNYIVTGEIIFKLAVHDEPINDKWLRWAIGEVDRKFLWKDSSPLKEAADLESEPIGNLQRLGDGIKYNHIFGVSMCFWRFKLWPEQQRLMKSQLHAYEKYLATLAEELSRMNIPNIAQIKSRLTIETTTDIFNISDGRYDTETAINIFKIRG